MSDDSNAKTTEEMLAPIALAFEKILNRLDDDLAELQKSKDLGYAERNRIVAALSMLWPSHLKRHPDSDKDWEDDWRTIVCIHGPAGQMTWHIHDSEAHFFSHLNMKPDPYANCEWDGHTTEEKYRRLLEACMPAGKATTTK